MQLRQERLPTAVRGQHPGDQQLWAAWEGLVYDQLLCGLGLRSGLGGQAPSRNQAPA